MCRQGSCRDTVVRRDSKEVFSHTNLEDKQFNTKLCVTVGKNTYPAFLQSLLINIYLRQGGYVFASVSLSVCLSSTLRKKLLTNFYETFRKAPERAKEQSIRFWG